MPLRGLAPALPLAVLLASACAPAAPDGERMVAAQKTFSREFAGMLVVRIAVTTEDAFWTIPGVTCRRWPTLGNQQLNYASKPQGGPDFRVNRTLEQLAVTHNRTLLDQGVLRPWQCNASDIYMRGPDLTPEPPPPPP